MKPLTNFIFLFLAILFTQACSQESAVPTNFEMTLGANAISDQGLNGGIILSGTNGVDKFNTGLTPNEASNFSLELPSGDWIFRAVGWISNGSGMMTGESRCGHTSAKIENTDTVVKLDLSSAQCFDGVIAQPSAQDSTVAGATYFKKLELESCLSLNGITGGDFCDGSTLEKLPGISTSVRLVFPGLSNFGASPSSLRSACINHPGFDAKDLTSGNIPTELRLPFNGASVFTWGLVAYEEKNCSKRAAMYRMPDGINGAQGLDRRYSNPTAKIKVNFADNYLGMGDSVFATLTPGDIIPKVNCAPNCYPNTNYQPFDKTRFQKDSIKKGVWNILGNAHAIDAKNITGATGASLPVNGGDILLQTDVQAGSLSSQIGIEFLIVPSGSATPVVNCPDKNINVQYDSAEGTTLGDVVTEVNDNCGHLATASTAFPAAAVTDTDSHTFPAGNDSYNLYYRDQGALFEMRNLLVGPIGVGLFKNGIQNRSSLCSFSGSYDFLVNGKNIKINLSSNPTADAVVPEFSRTSGVLFEKRIRVFSNGVPQESFYFNCTTNPKVGAYVSRDRGDNGKLYTEQLFWNSTTLDEEWVEWGSKEEDFLDSLVRQDYFLFKANTNGFNAYHLSADNLDSRYEYVVGKLNANNLYVQGGVTSQNDVDPSFKRVNDDHYTSVADDFYSATVAPQTVEPSMPTPSLFNGYDMSNFNSGLDNFWELDY